MAKGKNVPINIEKSIPKRLNDCEAHIYFLENALYDYANKNKVHYKQVAGELRVLVADNAGVTKHGLLIDLMDDLKIEYKFDYGDKKVSIKEFLSDFGAVLNRKSFTKKELIKEISQQEGSSHDTKFLKDHLVVAHSFQINGNAVHIEQMILDARYILGASKEFIRYMKNNFEYKPSFLDI